jgi:hypothetical protein
MISRCAAALEKADEHRKPGGGLKEEKDAGHAAANSTMRWR